MWSSSKELKEVEVVSLQVQKRLSISGPQIKPSVVIPRAAKTFSENISSSADEGSGDTATIEGSELGLRTTYPRLSRVLGERGEVTVSFEKNDEGGWNPPQVVQSSGFERLDKSAMEASLEAFQKGLLSSHLEKRSRLQIHFIYRLLKD